MLRAQTDELKKGFEIHTDFIKSTIRDQREEQGKRERNKRSGQRSAVLLATQQSNVQYLQRHVAMQGRQRRRIRWTRRDSMEQVDTVSVDEGEMTGDGVRTVRQWREVSRSRSPKESKKDENVRQR
jgi:hypothetical protein